MPQTHTHRWISFLPIPFFLCQCHKSARNRRHWRVRWRVPLLLKNCLWKNSFIATISFSSKQLDGEWWMMFLSAAKFPLLSLVFCQGLHLIHKQGATKSIERSMTWRRCTSCHSIVLHLSALQKSGVKVLCFQENNFSLSHGFLQNSFAFILYIRGYRWLVETIVSPTFSSILKKCNKV